MTVPSTPRRAGPYYGTGVLVAYPFTFKTFDKHDLRVVVADAGGVETDLVVDSSVLIALNADQNANPGGSLQYAVSGVAAALPAGYSLVILSALGYAQQADLPEGGSYRAAAVEQGLDALAIQIQQVIEQIYRTLTLSPLVGADVDATLPPPQADRLIGWNSAATRLQNMDPQTLATIVAYGTANSDVFTGDGVTATFTLSDNPGNLNNLDINIDGLTMTPGADYEWGAGKILNFIVPPPRDSNILVRYMQGLPQSGEALPNLTGGALKWLYNPNGVAPIWKAIDGNDVNFTVFAGSTTARSGDKLRQYPSFNDLGVSAAAANNYASAFTGISSISGTGAELGLARGTYVFGDNAAGAAIDLKKPISINGDGGVYTAINPSLAPSNASTIRFVPSNGWTAGTPNVAGFDFTLTRIQGIALHDPTTGGRTGRHGVLVDTQINLQTAPKFTMRDVIIGQGTDSIAQGFFHLNDATPVTGNVNGGMYGALLHNLVVKGGMRFDSTGDSNSITNCILSGSKIGVKASMAPGASLFEVGSCNITNEGGTMQLVSSSRFRFHGNNCENSKPGTATENNAAMVSLLDTNGPIYGGVMRESLLAAFSNVDGATDAVRLVRMAGCRGTHITDMTFLSGGLAGDPTIAIDILNSCRDVRIGPCIFNAAITTKVNDGGVGTMGVIKTTAALNGWVDFATGAATIIDFIKSPGDGIVTLAFSVKDGTLTNGVLVGTLPEGFRPSRIIRAPAFALNVTTPSTAEVTIETDGSIRFNYAKTTQVSVNINFPAANLAHATSLE